LEAKNAKALNDAEVAILSSADAVYQKYGTNLTAFFKDAKAEFDSRPGVPLSK
jgi:hypothetical protein